MSNYCSDCPAYHECDTTFCCDVAYKKGNNDVVDKLFEFIGFRNLDDWSQRYIKAKELADKLNELKR